MKNCSATLFLSALTCVSPLFFSCAPPDDGCDPVADADGDGIDDCAEADLGTNPDSADSDGDGHSDPDEIDCLSDPLDANEVCYACGWDRNDPGNIESTGAEIGDVIADFAMFDQCGESVDIYDMAQDYTILWMTAAW